jgi:hypothetical protein
MSKSAGSSGTSRSGTATRTLRSPSTERTAGTDQEQRYIDGIRAGKHKMVARVGQDEADKWERHAIASAHFYAYNYNAAKAGG